MHGLKLVRFTRFDNRYIKLKMIFYTNVGIDIGIATSSLVWELSMEEVPSSLGIQYLARS